VNVGKCLSLFARVKRWNLFLILCVGGYSLPSFAQLESQLRMGGSFYSQDKVNANQTEQSFRIFGQWQKNRKLGEGWELHLGFDWYNELEANPYPVLKNLNYQWQSSRWEASSAWIRMGLQTHEWSLLENDFHLGAWSSYNQHEPLRAELLGQLGIGAGLSKKNFWIKLFVSPVSIPNIGPQFVEREGQLLSSNRWFQTPLERVEIFGDEKQVLYDTSDLNLESVALQPSFFFHTKYRSAGWFAQWSSAYKPSNELLIMVDTPEIVSSESADTVHISTKPTVVREFINTMELGYQGKGLLSYVSATHLQATEIDAGDPDLLNPQVNDHTLIGMGVKHRFPFLFGTRGRMHWGAFHRAESKSFDARSTDIEVEYNYERFRWSDGLLWKSHLPFYIKSTPTELSTTLLHSPSERGTSLLLDWRAKLDDQFQFEVSFEVIGSEEAGSDSFFEKFKNNDRVYTGVRYAF
tara:strand:- start:74416 stop:75810 length:1395 start_codon:yes stop_codon:yes gene_type:complete